MPQVKTIYHFDRDYRMSVLKAGDTDLFQIGRRYCAVNEVIGPHLHVGWYELTVVTGGSGTITTGGVPCPRQARRRVPVVPGGHSRHTCRQRRKAGIRLFRVFFARRKLKARTRTYNAVVPLLNRTSHSRRQDFHAARLRAKRIYRRRKTVRQAARRAVYADNNIRDTRFQRFFGKNAQRREHSGFVRENKRIHRFAYFFHDRALRTERKIWLQLQLSVARFHFHHRQNSRRIFPGEKAGSGKNSDTRKPQKNKRNSRNAQLFVRFRIQQSVQKSLRRLPQSSAIQDKKAAPRG